MTSKRNEGRNIRNPAGGPMLREAEVGTKLLLSDGTTGEIIGNPGNGGFVEVRYLESPDGDPAVGDTAWLFVPTDVKDIIED